MKLNIVDTPGHADFGGEVERGLTMVDGVLLLVDASEGPLPQTRFVLRKALEAQLPVILVVNKVDRPGRADRRGRRRGLRAVHRPRRGRGPDRVPDRLHERAGPAGRRSTEGEEGTDLKPLMDLLRRAHPGARVRAGPPAAGARHQPRRLALPRPPRDLPRAQRDDPARRSRSPGAAPTARDRARKVAELYVTEALDRVDAEEAGPGEIIAVAGLPDVTIGETLADPEDPRAAAGDHRRRAVAVASRSAEHLAARRPATAQADLPPDQGPARRRELVGNVSIRVLETERPDTWEVQGRGELQLAILVELMRREGFELTVGKPQVVTREIDGKLHEPVERMTIDMPEDYVGVVTQLLALRKGRMEQMVNHGTGWVRMDYLVPARGLIGFRTEFLTETRGTGLLHHVFDRWEPWAGDMRLRPTGSLVADRRGKTAQLRAVQPAGARHAVRRARRGRLRGHDRRRERARRGPRRQRVQGEAPHQHALLDLRRAGPARAAAAGCRSTRRSSSCARTSASRSRRTPCGCARSSSTSIARVKAARARARV